MFTNSLYAEVIAALLRLRRTPAFSLAAILLLATGIGAVTTVYSIVDCLIVRPLPYREADRLIGLRALNQAKAIVQPGISVSDFRDYRERQRSLSAVGAYRGDNTTWQQPGQQPLRLNGALVTEDFFKVLGVAPLLGRTFTEDEFSVSAAAVAVITRKAWRDRFAADPAIIGRVLTINGQATTVIGVMPESIHEPALVETWRPFPREIGENYARDSRYWIGIGRLNPGISISQCSAEINTISINLAKEHADTNLNWLMSIASLQELRVAGKKDMFWILLGATGLLLIGACFNLANLLLGQGLRRRTEMATRLALGATGPRLLRQALLESLLLAMPGGVLGVGLAFGALNIFIKTIPPDFIPGANEVSLDDRVLLASFAFSVFSGLVAGFLPALQACQIEVGELIKQNGPRAGLSGAVKQTQRLLLVAQLSLTFIVLTGTALFARSFATLNAIHPGFEVANIYQFRATPPTSQDDSSAEWARYFEQLASAAKEVPGIEAAAVDASAPLTGLSFHFPYSLVGSAPEVGSEQGIYHFISSDYLRTTQTPLIAGRAFTERDDEQAARVVLVNQTMARRLSSDGNVIGQKLNLVPWLSSTPHEIVGVVADTLQDNLTDPAPPQLFVAQRQVTWFFSTLLVRTRPGVPVPATALREALQRIDPSLAVEFTALSKSVDRTTVQPRLLSLLFKILGTITLGFTLIGVYACINFTVAQRASEYGLRMALGATSGNIVRLMAGEIGKILLAALGLGLLGTFVFGQMLRSQLYGVEADDPLLLSLIGGSLVIATFVSASLPVFRAGSVSPLTALKQI